MGNGTTLHYAVFRNEIRKFRPKTRIKSVHIVGLAIVGTIIHFLALHYHWYFLWKPLDVPMHIGGGILLTLILFWIWEYRGNTEHRSEDKKDLAKTLLWCFVWIFIWGSLWELREFAVHSALQSSPLDTVSDYMAAFLGSSMTIAGVHLRTVL